MVCVVGWWWFGCEADVISMWQHFFGHPLPKALQHNGWLGQFDPVTTVKYYPRRQKRGLMSPCRIVLEVYLISRM